MLSIEQQKTIQESIWIVNTVLKAQKLSHDEDLRQSAILYMCKVIDRFDPSKGVKWETYAYKTMYLFVKRKHLKDIRKKFWEIDNEKATIIADYMCIEEPELCDDSKYMVERIKSLCTPKERQYLDLRLQGYKIAEIKQLMNVSQRQVGVFHQKIVNKAREKYL